MKSVIVRPARGRWENSSFINLPWRIYSADPLWIPPLKSSVRSVLNQKRHPFYANGEEAERELFVAWDGRHAVGRVAAIINHAYNRFTEDNVCFFGFFECIDRSDIALSLLRAVEVWADARGARAVLGPMNPSTNYECGLLVDGFARSPVLMMTYNPAYYPRMIENAGYVKAKDLLAYISPVHDASLERLNRLAERTRKRNPEVTTRGANLKEFAAEVERVQDIYNSAWERNWGFVPMSDAEITWLAKELKPSVEPELLRFAEVDGEPIGFILTIPDWNPVLRDFDGSLLRHPLRTLKHLTATKAKDMEGLRVITLGVKESYRKRGIEGVLMVEGLRVALELGFDWCEYSWILEDNELTKRAVRLMDGEVYKTYRIYQKRI